MPMNKIIDRRLMWLAVFAALVVLGMAFVVSCSCKSHDNDNDNDDDSGDDISHRDDDNDDNNNDATDDDSAPPADCQIVQCEPHDYGRLPSVRTGACFPEECEEASNTWSCDGLDISRLLCDEAVILNGKMWTQCSTYAVAHFCAACGAQVLDFCGYDDWRLPTYQEARSLYDPSRRRDPPGSWGEAYIREPFRLYDSTRVWLFVDENATLDDFGPRYCYRNDDLGDALPFDCTVSGFFIRDLDGTESFGSKERSKTAREQDH